MMGWCGSAPTADLLENIWQLLPFTAVKSMALKITSFSTKLFCSNWPTSIPSGVEEVLFGLFVWNRFFSYQSECGFHLQKIFQLEMHYCKHCYAKIKAAHSSWHDGNSEAIMIPSRGKATPPYTLRGTDFHPYLWEFLELQGHADIFSQHFRSII